MDHPDSISSVEPALLGRLVSAVLARADQNKITFDHLSHSHSVVHRMFKPHTPETFKLLVSILHENVKPQIANQIMANDQISVRLFSSGEEAESVVIPLMEGQLALAMGEESMSLS